MTTAKEFTTDQEVRWCPGCGDYAILKSVTKALETVGASPESTAFISGIGCAARFPYYINSYGFHTIHGRAPTIATGLKLSNPELDVWVVSGDGDALSIGGNHLMHALRRNIGLKILLFNNEVYGLTKGQYSPTSRLGTRTPSSPDGSFDSPVSAGAFALGSGAGFFARAIDTDKIGLGHVLEEAHGHSGTSLTEIYQNCIVYNEDVFASFTDRKTAADTQLHLRDGEKMRFGKSQEHGIAFDTETFALDIVAADDPRVLVHDVRNAVIARLLIDLQEPVALGVIYKASKPAYETTFYAHHPSKMRRTRSVREVINGSNSWVVEK